MARPGATSSLTKLLLGMYLLILLLLTAGVDAQLATNASSVASLNTASSTRVDTSSSFNSTSTLPYPLHPTPTRVGNSTSPPAASTGPPQLDTRVDATFGVLGALLVISGGALAFWGSRNRWTSFFLIGFLALAMVVSLLIVHFGVVQAVTPPSSSSRGLFLFASVAAGAISGSICVVWWKGAQYLCGCMGAFAVGMFILALKPDCLIEVYFARMIFLIGLAAVGFLVSLLDRAQHVVVLVGTSAVGSTALVLGVDCFTTRNLKEFYCWILFGPSSLFPKLNGRFAHTTAIQIELGVVAALFICAVAFQYRGYSVLVNRARELRREDRQRTLDEKRTSRSAKTRSTAQLEDWEEKYGLRSPASSSSATLLGMPELKSSNADASLSDAGFLPKLDLNSRNPASQVSPSSSSHAPAPTPTPPPPSSISWNQYISSRAIVVAPLSTNPARRSTASVADFEGGRLPSSAGTLSRPLSLATLPSPQENSGFNSTHLPLSSTSPDTPVIPRPRLIVAASSRPLSAATPRPLLAHGASSTRRNTMADFTTLELNPDRCEERVVTGSWSGQRLSQASRPLSKSRLMDVDELEHKHRQKLAKIQGTANKLVHSKDNSTSRSATQSRSSSAHQLKGQTFQDSKRRHSMTTLLLDNITVPGSSTPQARDGPIPSPTTGKPPRKHDWLGY